jgi:uncharacterized protein (TIGR02328 family)
MIKRGYNVDSLWLDYKYRGKKLGFDDVDTTLENFSVYPEHDDNYLKKCVDNLRRKGA